MQSLARVPAPCAGIAYAPALLPDELLYSWLARLAALNAMGGPRDVLLRIFGCRTLVPSVDLPTRLLAVERRLGGWLAFPTLDALLEDGTLLPYHRPFLTAASHSRVRHSLLHGDGKGLKTLMGRVANRFGAHPALRSCPDCLDDSWRRHGAFYWLRRHQLPGVNCCSIHGTLLQCVPLQARTHRQRLLLPAAMAGTPCRDRADARQLRFAQLSQDLVEAALPVIAPLQRAATYRDAALGLGYGTRRGRVDLPALAGALRRRFDDFDGFEHQSRLLATPAHPLGWLRPLFERPQRSLHPICHLLLIEFLFGSVAAFNSACVLCVPVSHDAPPAQAVEVPGHESEADSLAIEREAALRDPSLSCRNVAARFGQSVTTVVSWRRAHSIEIWERRKSLHPAVIGRVLQGLESQTSLPAVAAQAGVSLSSVYRILAQHPDAPRPRQGMTDGAQVALRRARWTAALKACRAEGAGGVSAARTRAGADYAWLYRHDRTWLASTTNTPPHDAMPPTQRRDDTASRVDWARRDVELCQALLQQLDHLKDEMSAQRLTKTYLLRPLGEAMVKRNLNRLPRLSALLNQVVESAQAFGMRRVDHAIAALVRDGAPLQLWRIRRLSGLRKWSDVLTAHAGDQVERLNAQNSIRPLGLS